jgi:putative solute:sodium symporter small subunit
MDREQRLRSYWKETLKYIFILLSFWFTASCLFGVILVEQLDRFNLFGFPLGFWFANQGSLIIFCILILVYVRLMNRLDQKYDVYED